MMWGLYEPAKSTRCLYAVDCMTMHAMRCGENMLSRDQGTPAEGGVESGIYKGNLIKHQALSLFD